MIIKAVIKDDPRPVWVVINAGSNTLAQALFDYKKNHTKEELNKFIAKLRVFENGAQDNAGAWICSNFSKIHWIRSNYQTYAYDGPGGTDGNLITNLGPNYWHPYENSTAGQLKWLKENVMIAHGALGEIYPERRFHSWPDGMLGFMEGGGTIPWMGLVNKGLFDIDQPSWGGWGGRFSAKKVAPFYTYCEVSDYWVDPQDSVVYNDNYVPVWRWREAMFNDQICRMDWCTKSFKEANHHPVAAFNGDLSDSIIHIKANPGELIALNASDSYDPDSDKLLFCWWVYQEAGTYPGHVYIPKADQSTTNITVPTGASGKQIHVILEIHDLNSIASLYDYRRIVIDVEN